MPWGSARLFEEGAPDGAQFAIAPSALLIGAIPTSSPVEPPFATFITPTPGVEPTALLTPAMLAVRGHGPRSVTNAREPPGDRSNRSGAGSALSAFTRLNVLTCVSLVVSTTSTRLAARSATQT